jgi:hypothetical protein
MFLLAFLFNVASRKFKDTYVVILYSWLIVLTALVHIINSEIGDVKTSSPSIACSLSSVQKDTDNILGKKETCRALTGI